MEKILGHRWCLLFQARIILLSLVFAGRKHKPFRKIIRVFFINVVRCIIPNGVTLVWQVAKGTMEAHYWNPNLKDCHLL